MRTSSTREFVWKRDGDENGVLYWLGTGGPERRRHPYRNPAKDGKVAVVASHSVSSSTAHWMFVGRSNARAYIDCRHPGEKKETRYNYQLPDSLPIKLSTD